MIGVKYASNNINNIIYNFYNYRFIKGVKQMKIKVNYIPSEVKYINGWFECSHLNTDWDEYETINVVYSSDYGQVYPDYITATRQVCNDCNAVYDEYLEIWEY